MAIHVSDVLLHSLCRASLHSWVDNPANPTKFREEWDKLTEGKQSLLSSSAGGLDNGIII